MLDTSIKFLWHIRVELDFSLFLIGSEVKEKLTKENGINFLYLLYFLMFFYFIELQKINTVFTIFNF